MGSDSDRQYLKVFNGRFPREIAYTEVIRTEEGGGDTKKHSTMKRRTVFDAEEMKKVIQQNIETSNTYYTIYGYESYNQETKRADYDTAIIDRILFDFDQDGRVVDPTITIPKTFEEWEEEEQEEWIEKHSIFKQTKWEGVKRLHMWCMHNDLKHSIVFTGRGYHVYIFTKISLYNNPKLTLRKAVLEIGRKAGYNIGHKYTSFEGRKIPLDIDLVPIGRTDQLARLIGGFSYKEALKGHDHVYVRSIPIEVFNRGHGAVQEYCKEGGKMRFIVYGNKLLNMNMWDDMSMVSKNDYMVWFHNRQVKETYETVSRDLDIDMEFDDAYSFFPPCIQTIITTMRKKKIDYTAITQLAFFLKQVGYSMEEQMRFWYENYAINTQGTYEAFKKQEKSWFAHTYGEKGVARGKGGYQAFTCEKSMQNGVCTFHMYDPEDINKQAQEVFGQDGADMIYLATQSGDPQKVCGAWMNQCTQAVAYDRRVSHPISYYETMRRENYREPTISEDTAPDVEPQVPPCALAHLTKNASGYTIRLIVSILFRLGISSSRIREIMSDQDIPEEIYRRLLDEKEPIMVSCNLLERRNLCIEPNCNWSNVWNSDDIILPSDFDDMERDFIVRGYITLDMVEEEVT